MKKLVLAFVLVIMSVMAAIAADVTKVFTVTPAMHCQNCENKIKTNLRYERGVLDIVTNVEAGTVTVKYNDKKTDASKIINAFKKIGYTAIESAPAEANAAEGHNCSGACHGGNGGSCGGGNSGCCGNGSCHK